MPIVNRLTPDEKRELQERIALREQEKGYKICGGRHRSDLQKFCDRPAGEGTDHKGIGRCYMHGGRNQSPASKNWTAGGKLSQIKYPDIIQKIEQLKQDRDVFDLRDHIFLMEAVAQTILQEADSLDDLKDLVKVVDTVTKSVQRLHDIEVGRKYVISVENLGNVIGRVVEVIERHVPDPYLRSLIAADIMKIHNTPIPALDARLIEGQIVKK